jgi:hypothetical protein
MELEQRIAWWEGTDLKLFKATDKGMVSAENGANGYTTLVLPGEVFSRRFHPRPFMNRDKLKKILPTFLLDSLLNEKSSPQSIASLGIQKTPAFTSFSVREDMLNDFVHKTGAKASPVVETVPLPVGLSFYVPKGEVAIVVAPTSTGVIAALIGDTGEVKDFRCVQSGKWKREANLTICGWKASGNINVYSIGSVFIPKNINSISVELPQSVPVEMAALNGIAQLYKKEHVETVLPAMDNTTQQHKQRFFKSLLVPLAGATVFTLFALANSWISGYTMEAQMAKAESEMEATFQSVLPNTPLVDPVAQVSRRLSELSYSAGEKIMVSAPLTEQITALQDKLKVENLFVRVNEVAVSSDSFKFRGTLNSLSDVDKVKNALATTSGKSVTLHHAQMVQGGKVDFYMEAK